MRTATGRQLVVESVLGSGDVLENALQAGNVDAAVETEVIGIDEMIRGNEIVNGMTTLLMTSASKTTAGTGNVHPTVRQKKQR